MMTVYSCSKDDDNSPPPNPDNNTTCTDGIQNGNETGVDCGGDCEACVSCIDGIQNGNETGIDCGGDCPDCPPTKAEAIIGIWEVTELSLNGNDYFSEFGVRKLYFNFRADMSYESFIINKNGDSDLNPSTYQPGANADIEIANSAGSDFYNCEFSNNYMTVTLTGNNAFETVALLQKVTEDLCANNSCVNTVECLYGHCICATGFIGEDCSGKLGPAGGIQIYDRGDNTGPFRYIEVSRVPFSAASVACPQGGFFDISGQLGYGAANCLDILLTCGELANEAVTISVNHEQNGFDDWHLPSSEELQLAMPYVNEIFGCPDNGTTLLTSTQSNNISQFYAYTRNCFDNADDNNWGWTTVEMDPGAEFVVVRYYN